MGLGGLEDRNREGYARSLERKGLEWDGDNNVEHMWEQVKRTMVESKRKVWLNENRGTEPKECAVERGDKSCS